jgi:hypothetical protein
VRSQHRGAFVPGIHAGLRHALPTKLRLENGVRQGARSSAAQRTARIIAGSEEDLVRHGTCQLEADHRKGERDLLSCELGRRMERAAESNEIFDLLAHTHTPSRITIG